MTRCAYFDAGQCQSCGWITADYADQLARKQTQSAEAFASIYDQQPEWLPAHASPTEQMRNKAKMAVAGTLQEPSLGLLELGRAPVDLSDCLLYTDELRSYFPIIKAFILRAQLAPYDPAQRRGELKFVLLTQPWPESPLMLRLVLRSKEALERIAKHLPSLQAELPKRSVVSVNLQPEHKAVLEGPTEIVLSEDRWLPVQFNQHQLLFGTQSFLQTNSAVASALYRQAAQWIDELAPASVLDLYCGVGAFAYHASAITRRVRGIEISGEAIAAAKAALILNGQPSIEFCCDDAQTALSTDKSPDLVIVNPPRRGLGEQLCTSLNQSSSPAVLYSSCNLGSLQADLKRLTGYRARRAQVFDMFPHTKHFEILVLLEQSPINH